MNLYRENSYDEERVISKLMKFLPFQNPLKDFVFQNLLQSFQNQSFHDALRKASVIFGYKNYLKLEEYRDFYKTGKINRDVFHIFLLIMSLGILLLFKGDLFLKELYNYAPTIFSFIGLVAVVKAFTERNSVRLSWSLVIINHLLIAMAISFNEHFDKTHILWYLSGVIISGIIGYLCIQRLRKLEKWVSLDKFYGHSYEHPKITMIFFIACLGLSGFPITPTFIGIDLIFSHIKENQVLLAFFVALSFVLNGLAVIRIYARIFLGPHVKKYHSIAKRSF
jgi:NADH-quinone oxidoreductase subunit L